MNKSTQPNNTTRAHLVGHYHAYPRLQPEDIFKFIFQSALGCEHLVSSEAAALEYINREYASLPDGAEPFTEALDGAYARVHLSCLRDGLKPETLARLFCLSAKKESNGRATLEQKLQVARDLVADGSLPFDLGDFDQRLAAWRDAGYPAVHHSDNFRAAYRPAYRVIAKRYADYLRLFTRIDKLLARGDAVVAIEGGSASGKSTLAGILQEVYDCNLLHMDDFFLRPEQRTPARLAEVGGNLDRERFFDEVVRPLGRREEIRYRRFDCSSQALGEPITIAPKKLTVVEGVYAMHPAFGEYYSLSVFLDIDPARQKDRILKRNGLPLANRFFEEWIPLENRYFSQMQIRSRCTECFRVL